MKPIRRYWFLLPILALAAVGLWRLRFDVEVLHLLPQQLPEVHGLALYNEHFANARELIISVQGAEPSEVERGARMIAEDLRQLTNRVASAQWQPPWRENPEQSAALLAYAWLNQPPEQFRSLVTRLQSDALDRELKSVRRRLATTLSPEEIARLGYDPVGFTRLPDRAVEKQPQFGRGDELFASADGKFRLVLVQATSDLADYHDCAAWLTAIRQEVKALRHVHPELNDLTIRYTGRPAFVSEIAGGMQSDMIRSVIGTGLIVAALFWWAHRRWKPMLWLITLLASAIGLTLALGGLAYGALNVVSVGFAAILLGLTVDYGMVLFQEWRETGFESRQGSAASARSGVIWSALTTATAFLMLNLSGLPGLAQLGTLVAIGIGVGACLMLSLYLVPFRHDKTPQVEHRDASAGFSSVLDRLQSRGGLVLTAVVLLTAIIVLRNGLPSLNRSPDALRPRGSPAYAALNEIQQRMQSSGDSLWLILSARNELQMGALLEQAQEALAHAREQGSVASFALPVALWPHPANAAANREAARELVQSWPAIRDQILSSGFTSNALMLARGVMHGFDQELASTNIWPTNAVAQWSLGQFTARTPTNLLVMGLVHPASADASPVVELPGLPKGQSWLVSWQRMGNALAGLVRHDLTRVLIPTIFVIVVCLGLAFRRLVEVCLGLGALLFSLLTLCAAMKLAGWSWNLLNLMALPLLLGVGVDYSIHTLLALRRNRGDLRRTRRSVGRALFLCAATTAAGFGSLAFSNNAGLASLGQVCATGVALSYVTATVLLPGWWLRTNQKEKGSVLNNDTSAPSEAGGRVECAKRRTDPFGPSSFYGASIWRAGLWLGKRLPCGFLTRAAAATAFAYRTLAGHRFEIVKRNLRPLCMSDSAAASLAKQNFRQFAQKVVDLWVYESGGSIEHLFGALHGLENVQAAQASGRGLLLVTPHLGNWEFGAPLLVREGLSVQVVTLSEPDAALTRLRQESRRKWNIETVVIGADPFGFVELIRRLEDGATVALLVDRPVEGTAVDVEFSGRPFKASFAPAELARATGCAILPVHVIRKGQRYEATAMPPIDYDRASLRDPVARRQLTQRILSAFEPVIREHADQWYHFVPIWPEAPVERDRAAMT